METITFKSRANYEAAKYISEKWISEQSFGLIVVQASYFFDRIDETHTVIVSYYR